MVYLPSVEIFWTVPCVVCGKRREEGSVLLSYLSTTTEPPPLPPSLSLLKFFRLPFLLSHLVSSLFSQRAQISNDDDDDDERGNVLAGYTKFPFMKALVSFSVLMIVKWQRCVQRVHLISCCFLLLLSYFTWCTGKYSTCFWKVFFERGKKRMILLIMRKVCVQKSSLFCYYYIPYHFIPACYKVA